jgi:hypothetical protein
MWQSWPKNMIPILITFKKHTSKTKRGLECCPSKTTRVTTKFNIFWAVHLRVILLNNQLDANIFDNTLIQICSQWVMIFFFYVYGSMHRESMSITVQQDATMYSLLHFCKLLYMFWVVTPPIIRSIYNCNYSTWHWSNFRKCIVWSQLKMRGMYPSLLPSAFVEYF